MRLAGPFTVLLRVLLVLNIVCAVAFALVLAATLPIGPASLARLADRLGPGVDAAAALDGVRMVLVIGLLAVVAAHVLLRALRDIASTVRVGDPFLAANASRIRRIGWMLLALQLLDLGFGAVAAWVTQAGVDGFAWAPSLTGWLAALAAFVLAEVWAQGSAMRDELAATV